MPLATLVMKHVAVRSRALCVREAWDLEAGPVNLRSSRRTMVIGTTSRTGLPFSRTYFPGVGALTVPPIWLCRRPVQSTSLSVPFGEPTINLTKETVVLRRWGVLQDNLVLSTELIM